MKKVIKGFSIAIICLFALSVFGWMSVHVSKGDKDFGFLNEPISFMSSFFDQFKESVEEVKQLSPTYLQIWAEVNPVNRLDSDLKVLFSYSETNFERAVIIKNLKNDSIVYKWNIPEKVSRWGRLVNPYPFPNKDLVYFLTDNSGLRRIDSAGNFIWKQDQFRAHHSLEVDSEGNFWVCSKIPPKNSTTGTYKIDNRPVYYDDDYLTRVDAKSGEVLFHKSVTEILKNNGLESYLLQTNTAKDPIHLNDIQPALKTTKYYDEGDLFISIKQSSILLHYRPATNEVLKVIEGPFSAQHDVDFYNDSTLTIFNNNSYPQWTTASKGKPNETENLVDAGNFYSNIIRYELGNQEFSVIGQDVFSRKSIFTSTEGLHEFINDSTYFVEEQNTGYYWVIQNDKVIYKDVFRSQKEEHCHLPNWARIIQE